MSLLAFSTTVPGKTFYAGQLDVNGAWEMQAGRALTPSLSPRSDCGNRRVWWRFTQLMTVSFTLFFASLKASVLLLVTEYGTNSVSKPTTQCLNLRV